MKARFVIIGSGWRAMYYVRIAKALPEKFELGAVLCRTQERADKISHEMAIHTTTSIEECEQYKPDFVVVAVNKSSIYEVSKEWMVKGFTVLCETPAALELEQLQELWRLRTEKGYKLCVAEQYFRYPTYAAMLSVLESQIIGEPCNVTLSVAHDYHGASLIRKILKVTGEAFSVSGRRHTFPVTETASRYEKFRDGKVSDKRRDRISFEFENGKAAFYDFCSEQYRSPIRSNYVNVQGIRGEIKDEKVCYLDENNEPHLSCLTAEARKVVTGSSNPNLSEITEITKVSFEGKVVYESSFSQAGLSEDETAIADLMAGAAEYSKSGMERYPLDEALQDAYMAILMQKAVDNPGQVIRSEKQPWHKGGK